MNPEDSPGPRPEDIALTITQDGKKRLVTVRELTISNKIACDALLALLIQKGLITGDEFQQMVQQLTTQHYRPGPDYGPALEMDPPPKG